MLRRWENEGKIKSIRSPGNHRLYDVNKYLKEHKMEKITEITKENICYVRVSTAGQKNDLERQKNI